MIHTAEINFKNGGTSPTATYGNHTWLIGEQYDIAGLGSVHVHGAYDRNDGTGVISVHYSEADRNENNEPTDNSLISIDGVNVGQVDGAAIDVYIPAQNIMSFDNPEYGWNIDRFGAGLTSFYEGPPQITAMGNLKINDAKLLASYDFSKSNLPNEFVNSREGGSDVSNSWDPVNRGVKLAVGTAQGARVTQTSNLFHSYEEGIGILFVMAVRSGDTGKQDVTRLWGAFDASDGFFFQIKGSDDAPGGRASPVDPVGTGPGSALRVVHRFTFNGLTKNHEILQKEWNQDTLLGTGGASNPSGMNIDVSKINTYWIDYQFVGGGRTRWGVFYQGERIVCHEMYHHNGIGVGTQNHHPISNPSRPMCFAQANYGASSPSSSEFFAFGGGVFVEGVTDPLKTAQQVSIDYQSKMFGSPESKPYWRTKQTRNGSSSSFPSLLKTGSYSSQSSSQRSTQYAYSLSPKQFLLNPDGTEGDENHTVYQPLIFGLNAHDYATNNKEVVEIRAFYGCVMRGVEYKDNLPSTPTVQYEEDGDHLAHIIEIGRFVIDGIGQFNFSELSDNFQYGTVRNTSDQNLARQLHPLTEFISTDDKYSTGVSRVKIKVGPHPIYGVNRHSFSDTQPVVIREVDGDQDVPTILGTTFTGKTAGGAGYASFDKIDNPADWHFLSYVTRDEAWLYNSQADITDDRLTRTLNVTDCANLQLGDKITVTPTGATAFIMKVDVDTSNTSLIASSTTMTGATEYQIVSVGNTDYTALGATINQPGEIFTASGAAGVGSTGTVIETSGNEGTVAICGRSSAQIDYLGAFTTDGGGAGTITSNGTDAGLAKDYWTSLKALQYDTDLGMGADVDLSNSTGPTYTGLALYGNPTVRAAWTFMSKWLDNTTEDEDGDASEVKPNTRMNWNVFWRERQQ
jgi:hypothetical protein